ncbi:MAG: dihydrolipoyl dehydrogenase [Opitutales bacterium]
MYDLGIIGAGPGGYVAAERAGQAGLNTVLFEKDALGGVCLNTGCIPTKTLLNSVKHLSHARDAKAFGVLAENVGFDFNAIMKRKRKIVKKLVAGVAAKMKHNNVEVVQGAATIQERGEKGIVIECGGETYEFKNVIIATGSLASIPPIEGLDREHVLTNVEALDLKELPEKMVIVGGGVIGLEFTDIFSTLGVDVTIVEMMDEVMPSMDSDLAAMLRETFEKRGVDFHLGATVTKLEGKTVHFEKAGKTESIAADEVLVSVGRVPNFKGCGLENIGVEVENGTIKIDEKCRTNVPGVYAIGDVTGGALLAHTASRAGEVVVNNLVGREDRFRGDAIPWVEYTHPEVAGVGLTEDEANAEGREVEIRKLPMAYAGRFVAETNREDGFCKIIADPETKQVLGVHMIGGVCSEMIYGAAMALEMEVTLDELEEVIFPHPTVSEIIRETAFSLRS